MKIQRIIFAIIVFSLLTAFSAPQASVKTITASGTIVMKISNVGGYSQTPVTIRLQSVTSSSYKGKVIQYDQTKNIYLIRDNNTFSFNSIPANGQPMKLTLTFTNVRGDKYSTSGTFSWTCSALLRCNNGKFGTYTYTYSTGSITYKKP